MQNDSGFPIRIKKTDYRNVIPAFLLSLISVKGLSLKLPTYQNPSFQRVMPQSFLWIILFFMLWAALSMLPEITDPGMRKTAFRLTVFYSICNTLGFFYKTCGSVSIYWSGLNASINFFCYLVGYGCLVYCFILFLLRQLPMTAANPSSRLCSNTGTLFVLVTVILLIIWTPWFLTLNPGVTTPDSDNQIAQVMGLIPLGNNHPVFHTLFIKLLFLVCGTSQKCVMLYSIIQLILSALSFSVCICFIDSTFRRKIVTIAVIFWFAFYPVYPIYGMTVWKDVPFALCILLTAVNICRIIRDEGEETQKNLLLQNAVLFLVLCFLRHNGILVFIPTAAVILFHLKNYKKVYFTACIAAAAVYLLFQYAGVPLLNITAGRKSEGFSIPLQQIARAVSKHQDDLTEEQNEILSQYFSGDLSKLYRATLSDRVKKNFHEEKFAQDPKPILRLWWELGKKNPIDYIESILNNSYGFWYPEEEHATFFFGQNSNGYLGINDAPLIDSPLMQKARDYLQNMRYYSVPILSWMFSPAIGAWILIFTWFCNRYRRNKFWIAEVPLLSLWIQMFGSPAYCEYRYVYGLFTCLPLIICCTLLPLGRDADIPADASPYSL